MINKTGKLFVLAEHVKREKHRKFFPHVDKANFWGFEPRTLFFLLFESKVEGLTTEPSLDVNF